MSDHSTATTTPPTPHDGPPGEVDRRFGPVLRNRNFMYIFVAQGLSQIAYHAVNFALVVLVETLTRSSTAVSLIILAFGLPAVLFSGLAGVLVDRSRKRQVMVITTALRTLVLAGLIFVDPSWPALLLFGSLYLATFLFSTLSQFFGPAEGAVIPMLVPRRQLIVANSLFNLTFFASQLIGFAVAGPVLAKLVGLRALFEVATGLYLLCTFLVWLLPQDAAPVVERAITARRLVSGVWADLSEGAREIWRDRLLVKAIAYLSLSSSAFLMLGAIGPAFVTRVLESPAEDLGFILAPAGLGIIAGIVLVNRFATQHNRERMIDWGLLIAAVSSLGFAVARPLVDTLTRLAGLGPQPSVAVGLVMAVAAVFGASMAYILVPSQTLLQERSTDKIRARVYAAFYTVSSAASLGPVLFAGALSDLFGVSTVLLLVAAALLVISIISRRASHRSMAD